MGSKLDPKGNFPKIHINCSSQPASAFGNIWYRAGSRPLHSHAEGQEVTEAVSKRGIW